MKRIILLSFCAFGFLFFVAHSGAEVKTEPGLLLQKAIQEVRETVKAKQKEVSEELLDEELERIISPMFDFREMSRRSLGKNWRDASSEEQEEFVILFSALLKRNYLAKIRENVEGSSVKFVDEKTKGNKAIIKTDIHYEGEPVSIQYRLKETKKKWRIYDVIIANVGLVSNYRNEFSGIVRKEQMSGLLKRLREKNTAETVAK